MMTGEEAELEINIYVLPTITHMPPRAVVYVAPHGVDPTKDAVVGNLAMWSADLGTWAVDGMPVPPDLAEAITGHARDLGVDL
jgi:hypothetical protein